jgi:hypothetical protein
MTTCASLDRPAAERAVHRDPSCAHRQLMWSWAGGGALAAVTLLTSLVAVLVAASGPAAAPTPSVDVVMPDTGMSVFELVGIVRDAAQDVPGGVPDAYLDITFVNRLPGADGQPYVGGLQQGSSVWVRVGVAMPTRTLVHEVAHAVTPGAGHGDRFRDVYLAAFAEVYDEAMALREARRLAWVYDRCYRNDSCPVVGRLDGTAGSDPRVVQVRHPPQASRSTAHGIGR